CSRGAPGARTGRTWITSCPGRKAARPVAATWLRCADGTIAPRPTLAPLCRRHHRAKTHAGWSYVMVTPGTYLWHSPGGTTALVDARGTFRVPDVGQVCGHAAATRRAEPPPWQERAPGSARAGSGPAHQAGSPHP